MIVLDASATVEWLLQRPLAGAVASRFSLPEVSVHAPAVLGVEVTAALRGLALGGHLTAARGAQALAHLAATGIESHDPAPLLGRAWELRGNLTSYDAVYVALARGAGRHPGHDRHPDRPCSRPASHGRRRQLTATCTWS